PLLPRPCPTRRDRERRDVPDLQYGNGLRPRRAGGGCEGRDPLPPSRREGSGRGKRRPRQGRLRAPARTFLVLVLKKSLSRVRPLVRRSTAMPTRRKTTKSHSKPTMGTSPPTTASGQTGSGLPLDVVLTLAKESAEDFSPDIGF